jgi:hypothetical protein
MDELSLRIALLGGADLRLRSELRQACRAAGHDLLEVTRLRDLRSQPVPDVVVLDSEAGPEDAVQTAWVLLRVHPELSIVLVADEPPPGRSLDGFRVVDRWRAGERLVDELELAWIGIPASVSALG